MGFWDLFKKKPPPRDPDAVDDALAKLAAGDARGAFLHLRPLVGHPAKFEDVAAFARVFGAFAKVVQPIAGPPFAALIRGVSATPGDAKALYDAGYEAYEQQLFDVAATLFLRANQLEPGQPQIVTEAAGALEHLLRYGEAALVIGGSGLHDRVPICAYLNGYYGLMCGDRAPARRAIETLRDDQDPTIIDVRTRLMAMLARADALAAAGLLADDALTAWHMALNGTLLLHESPHGFPEPMHGRYAYVSDNPQLMHIGIERLHALLDRAPAIVVHAPDRASRLLGIATAARFGVPLVAWTPALGSPADALVVAWTLDAVGDAAFLQALHSHAPGQVLFAHGSDWVSPFPFAPDVTTFLYQTATNPFTGGALAADLNGKVGPLPPDDRPDDVLAAVITSANEPDDSASTLELVQRVRDAVKGLSEPNGAGMFARMGQRGLQRAGSVVPSARFNA